MERQHQAVPALYVLPYLPGKLSLTYHADWFYSPNIAKYRLAEFF